MPKRPNSASCGGRRKRSAASKEKDESEENPRSSEENKERAYVAASRRVDRSLEARIASAKMASEVHRRRTGKAFKITDEIVQNELMYEEEEDRFDPASVLQPFQKHFEGRLNHYLTQKYAASTAVAQSNAQWRSNAVNQLFSKTFPGVEEEAQQAQQLSTLPTLDASTAQPSSQPMDQAKSQSTKQAKGQSMNQVMNQAMGQPMGASSTDVPAAAHSRANPQTQPSPSSSHHQSNPSTSPSVEQVPSALSPQRAPSPFSDQRVPSAFSPESVDAAICRAGSKSAGGGEASSDGAKASTTAVQGDSSADMPLNLGQSPVTAEMPPQVNNLIGQSGGFNLFATRPLTTQQWNIAGLPYSLSGNLLGNLQMNSQNPTFQSQPQSLTRFSDPAQSPDRTQAYQQPQQVQRELTGLQQRHQLRQAFQDYKVEEQRRQQGLFDQPPEQQQQRQQRQQLEQLLPMDPWDYSAQSQPQSLTRWLSPIQSQNQTDGHQPFQQNQQEQQRPQKQQQEQKQQQQQQQQELEQQQQQQAQRIMSERLLRFNELHRMDEVDVQPEVNRFSRSLLDQPLFTEEVESQTRAEFARIQARIKEAAARKAQPQPFAAKSEPRPDEKLAWEDFLDPSYTMSDGGGFFDTEE